MARHNPLVDGHPELPDEPDAGPLSPAIVGLVGLGGAFGTWARYGLAQWLPAGTGFPRDTFIANLLGALVLGGLLEVLARRGPDTGARRKARLLIGTGFCGGLTTYSTFALENDLLARAHHSGLAVVYAIVTLLTGPAMATLGIAVAARVHRRSA